MQPFRRGVLAVAAGLVLGAPAAARAQGFWTDWTSSTGPGANGSAVGSLNVTGAGTIGVTYSGQIFFAQTAPGSTDYWTPRPPSPNSPYVSTALGISNPTNTDLIALSTAPRRSRR
jgi:hypothetical protein